MARFLIISAAILVLTASWVSAGNFEMLADAVANGPHTPLHINAGDLVKAEFKTNLNRNSEIELETDTLFPEPASAKEPSHVKARPAVAYRERGTRGMAPPPRLTPKSQRLQAKADSSEESPDLESDLEKDLVITPPPPKPEQKPSTEQTPAVEQKAGAEKKAVTEKKAGKKKAHPAVKRIAPSQFGNYAAYPKPIRKVHPPVAQNPWSYPAGAYDRRPLPSPQYLTDEPRRPVNHNGRYTNQFPRAMNPNYANVDPRSAGMRPGPGDRMVRDGVTIKLAPAAAPPYPPDMPEDEDSAGSDILSSAAEIIGLPFAFISSFF
jgi:hypothetical protein